MKWFLVLCLKSRLENIERCQSRSKKSRRFHCGHFHHDVFCPFSIFNCSFITYDPHFYNNILYHNFAFSPSKSSNFNRSKSITNDACFIRLIFKQANKQQQQQLQENL
ncbi:Histidine protein methyltransferase [Trichinella pseudospiralis]